MRKNKKKAGGAGGIIILVLIFLALSDSGVLGGLIAGVAGLIGVGAIFVAVMALVTALIIKATKNKGYVEPQRDNKVNKNPHSVNYDKDAVEREAKERAAQTKKPDVVVNGYTVKETPVEKEANKAPEKKHISTGDPDIDKMIVDKDLAIEEMKRLDEAIVDEKLSEQIVHLEAVTEKIVQYIIEHPKKKNQVSKFFSYYLPTTIKLLNAYDRMDDVGVSGTNIDGTKDKVEDMMETALAAFDKQLDALFADEALDVSTDIKVMENMLKSEGLTDDSITLTL